MFCKNCGTQLKEGAAFCHQCGIMLGANQPPQAAQPMQPQAPISEVPPMPMPHADENSAPASAAEPETAMPLNNEQAVPNDPSASQVYRMPPYAQPLQPTQKDNSGFACIFSLESTSRSVTVSIFRFGTSTPTRLFPGIGASIRTVVASMP